VNTVRPYNIASNCIASEKSIKEINSSYSIFNSYSLSIVLVKFISAVPSYTAPQGNPKGLHYYSPEVKKLSIILLVKNY